LQLRALLETQAWQQFLEASGGKGPEQLPFFDRILRELEKEDIGPGPAIMEITLEQPAPPQVIMSVKPPEVKDGQWCHVIMVQVESTAASDRILCVLQ